MWIAVAAVIVAIFAGAVVMIRLRRDGGYVIKPYKELRQDMIDSIGDPDSPDPVRPQRPAGLDCRVRGSLATELHAVWPVTKENYTRAMDIFFEITGSIREELDRLDDEHLWYELLSPERRAVIALDTLEAEINNGGFDQYYLNSSGDGARLTPDSLRLLGLEQVASIVERANGVFAGGPSPFRARRMVQLEALDDSHAEVMDELDSEFFALESGCGGVSMSTSIPFILHHEAEFFKG